MNKPTKKSTSTKRSASGAALIAQLIEKDRRSTSQLARPCGHCSECHGYFG